MTRMKDLREARGMTQAQLGKKIGASRSAVSMYEIDARQLTPALICTLCDLFDCTADFLLGRSASPSPAITDADAELLQIYHALPLEIRRAVDGLLAPYRPEEKEKTGS